MGEEVTSRQVIKHQYQCGTSFMSEKPQNIQTCEAQTDQLARNISCEHSLIFPDEFLNQDPTAFLE